MYVIKRNGNQEPVHFDKITNRIRKLCNGLNEDYIDPTIITSKIAAGIYNGITTHELDKLAAETAAYSSTFHPDWSILAARIAVSDLHKNTTDDFASNIQKMKDYIHPITKKNAPLIAPYINKVVQENALVLNQAIKYERDFDFDYFGFKTLEKSYLLKMNGKVSERPQQMYMRVAVAIHTTFGPLIHENVDMFSKEGEESLNNQKYEFAILNVEKAIETYELMSTRFFTHATPTLFNAGTVRPQLSSCFLLQIPEDSVESIYDTLKKCAMISKYAGGIGLSIHDIRGADSYIAGTNGISNGIVPMLRVYNDTSRYIDQGGQKRKGSIAVYLEPWHSDIYDFLELKKNTGKEELRARDLFYGLWIPDLFMKRVEENDEWTLFCPNEAPGLSEVHSEEFEKLYLKYESQGLGRKSVKAQHLWFHILQSQIETGTPYLLYKDAANFKSNQKNLGVIKSSNLCVAPETLILTDRGYIQIKDLKDQEVNVWNGDKWSKTTVRQTGENQKLITVYLSNGTQITCTPYHKFIVRDEYHDKKHISKAKRVEAWQLQQGDKLTKFDLPIIEGNPLCDIKYPYTHGFFCGDGTTHKRANGTIAKTISLYGEKKLLIDYLDIKSATRIEDASGRLNTLLHDDMDDKYIVPIHASIKCKLEWLAGLLDSDGCICRNGTNESFQIGSIHSDFLYSILLMLQTMGIQSKVTKAFEERKNLLPDGKGGKKEFDCKALWRLLISSSGLHKLKNLGLTCKRLKFEGNLPQRNAEQFATVIAIGNYDRVDDTYCFNEPENHAGVFNGILTGNCSEIIEYTSKDEIAVCNLASIALNRYVNTENKTFDFEKLMNVTKTIVYNLNNVIDTNFYPVIETLKSNMRHRPIGIGVQGLADTFALMRYPFESEEASRLNSEIFACIYYAALEASCELASVSGTYSTYAGSPTSQGLLQFDLWNTKPIQNILNSKVQLNWDHLKKQISQYGLRNSLLLAPMPTASTAQILGNNESIEPFTSNIYSRKVLSGEFPLVNKHLLRDLIERGIWNSRIRMQLLSSKGSVQNIPEIPNDLKELYKTVWEIKQKTLIDLSASRGVYVCQSQSLNLFVAEPTISKLSSMHFYTWKKGLKTGIYYLRTQPKADAIQFTVSLDGPVDDFKIKKSGIEDNKYKTREERAAAERAAIRAAIARGEYDDDESVCINCSG